MVALLWTGPASTGGAPVDYYVVRQATSPAGPWVEIAKPAVLGYFVQGLNAGSTYWFQVAAHNAAGTSAPGTIVSAVPMTVPGPPTKLESSLWYDEITLTWQPPSFDGASPVNQYQVEAATNLAGPWTTVATPVARLHVAKGAWPGLTYYFRVSAHNAMGWGPKTNITVAVPPKPPSAPTNCAANQLGGNGSDTARITWNPPDKDGGAPVLFYEITVYKYNGPVVMKTSVWSPGTSYDADLPTGDPWQRYDIYISPFNKAGIGQLCTVPVWMYDKDF
jgi:hypothetical protein